MRWTVGSAALVVVFVFYVCWNGGAWAAARPNIILLLTDDQDIMLGGMEPMSFARRFFSRRSVSFDNAFAATPVCCPSRATILTGRYQHNTLVWNNSLSGNCCGNRWRAVDEPHTIAARLRRVASYITFYGGKYLNQYGREGGGGVKHVPAGWDWWVGLVGNSRYYNYSLSVNGTRTRHGHNYRRDYLTDVLAEYALEFLRDRRPGERRPFMMTIAVPAPHSPHIPAPQFSRHFANKSAPRTASFNLRATRKHSLLSEPPSPLPDEVLNTIDEDFRDRWRCLLSVDDLLRRIVMQLRQQRLIDNTVLLLTSDHGYHLGQFSMPADKRQLYEFDVRVPLKVRLSRPLYDRITKHCRRRGAGRVSVAAVVSLVDLCPTLVHLATLQTSGNSVVTDADQPWSMEGLVDESAEIWPPLDGMSLVPLMNEAVAGTCHTDRVPRRLNARRVLISYRGEYGAAVDKQCRYRGANVSNCYVKYACKCQDNRDNYYACLRQISPHAPSGNIIVCYFPLERLWEVYDLTSDPGQLVNLAANMSRDERVSWMSRLHRATHCTGHECCML